jgi:hypothetical protein
MSTIAGSRIQASRGLNDANSAISSPPTDGSISPNVRAIASTIVSAMKT